MNVYFSLCGNKYSEVLSELSGFDSGILLIHRSNQMMTLQRIKRLFILFFAIFLRYSIVSLLKGNFILMVPHLSGNYGRISRVLQPDEYIIIDDGVTFEYWSDFHDKYISPIFSLSEKILIIGPRQPNWIGVDWKKIKLQIISRKNITGAILKKYKSDERSKKNTGNHLGFIIDDGEMKIKLLETLKNNIKKKFECEEVRILWHPIRGSRKDISKMRQAAEVSILCSNVRPVIVIGKASTTLFNVKAYDPSIHVASFPTEYFDLDNAAYEQGIVRFDI